MQLNYDNPPVAQSGQLADGGFHDVISGNNSDEGEVALFGHLMVHDDADNKVKRPALATDITALKAVAGIVLRSQHIPSAENGSLAQYPVKSSVPLLRKGRVWVPVEDAVDPSKAVYVRYAGTGNKGAFAGATQSMENAVLPEGAAKWLSTTSGAGLALLEINL